MVLNGQEPGRHPLGDAPYLNLDTVLNEQGSDRATSPSGCSEK
jgi:hypothetical protein